MSVKHYPALLEEEEATSWRVILQKPESANGMGREFFKRHDWPAHSFHLPKQTKAVRLCFHAHRNYDFGRKRERRVRKASVCLSYMVPYSVTVSLPVMNGWIKQ